MYNDGYVDAILPRQTRVTKRLRKRPVKMVGSIMLSELLPFRATMVRQLERRGFHAKAMDFKSLCVLYHNEFASNQVNPLNPYIPVNSYEFRSNPAFRIRPSDSLNGNIADVRNRDYFIQIGNVVDNVVNVFRTAKEKKYAAIRQGIDPRTALTDEELLQANSAIRVQNNLESKMTMNAPVRIKDFKNVVIFALAFYAIWYIFN